MQPLERDVALPEVYVVAALAQFWGTARGKNLDQMCGNGVDTWMPYNLF
jgi:hypothetical protein